MVNGVTKPFVKELEIQGVGYRAEAEGKTLKLAVGYSHPVEMPIPDGGVYYMLNSGGKPRGGATAAINDDVAGRWLPWVQVGDVDNTVGRVRSGGGRTITDPFDYPGVGRMSMVADPTGAAFGVITPAAK